MCSLLLLMSFLLFVFILFCLFVSFFKLFVGGGGGGGYLNPILHFSSTHNYYRLQHQHQLLNHHCHLRHRLSITTIIVTTSIIIIKSCKLDLTLSTKYCIRSLGDSTSPLSIKAWQAGESSHASYGTSSPPKWNTRSGQMSLCIAFTSLTTLRMNSNVEGRPGLREFSLNICTDWDSALVFADRSERKYSSAARTSPAAFSLV